MKIFRGVRNNFLVQKFGKENTKPSLLSLYESLGLLGHDGWDWSVLCQNNSVKTGGGCENIYCDIDGYATITAIYRDVKTGFGIVAQDQNSNYKHLWWHFDSINPDLKVGDRIEGGDLLGVAGNTGYSTGAHLHRALYSYADYNNGYHGAIDIEPYFVSIFVNDFIDNLKSQIGILQKIIEIIKNLFK